MKTVFKASDFDSTKVFNVGDKIILIDPVTYVRTSSAITSGTNTVYSLGHKFIIEPGITKRREGFVTGVDYSTNPSGTYTVDASAFDGLDNDLDGLIDENEAIDLRARASHGLPGLKFADYLTARGGLNDPLIDEKTR